jgi:hypothetical protein
MDTVITFKDMYDDFLQQQNVPVEPSHNLDAIAVAFKEKAKEISYTRRKAEHLLSKIQNTRTLVSNILFLSLER